MRVLLLTDFYPPLVGGVEQHVRMLGRELARRGHGVTVATVHPGRGLPDVEDDKGVRVHRLRSALGRLPGAYEESARPFAPPAPDPELVLRLAALIRRVRPDVVHAHGWIVHSWLPLAPVVDAPLVVTAHEYGLVCPRKDLRYLGREDCSGPSLAKCLRCAGEHYGPVRGTPIVLGALGLGPLQRVAARQFIAVSRTVADRNGLDLTADDVSVIPNFLPDEATADASSASSRPSLPAALPDGPFLLFVGALGAHKGFKVLVDAYARLGDAPPLVAIGHRWVDTPSDLPRGVIVHEDWPNEAVREAWGRALFGVIPSTWQEPFGIVALEAMAAGRAVVASRTGGLADIIAHEETGLLVPPSDPATLATAMRRLLDDAALRERLGTCARERMAEYRASTVVPRIEAVYAAARTGR
jgi:glycosyltransferase involved in cell wall biosynthesis